MSGTTFHDAAMTTFVRILNNISVCLDKAEAHAAAKKFDFDVLLSARLAPDMFPLMGQLQMVSTFPKNAMCRIAGQTPPDFPGGEKTLADIRASIARCLDIVRAVPKDDFNAGVSREITFQAGPEMKLTISGFDFLYTFALPNFYFHAATAYDILRHNGVDVGKMDFLGQLQ